VCAELNGKVHCHNEFATCQIPTCVIICDTVCYMDIQTLVKSNVG
jgi:hypothetical protein